MVLALIAAFCCVSVVTIRHSNRAAAATFDRNNLMSDAVFNATGTMSTAQIQSFLNRYPHSCLRSYSAPLPIDYSTYGGNTSAAAVIHASAQLYGVNPQVLLVTLEKEQNLVTGNSGCSSWRYWSAMGYACPDGGARYDYPSLGIYGTCVSAERHAGFSAQVNHGAWQLQFNAQRAVGNLNWRGNQSIHNYGFYTKGYRQQYAGAPIVYYDGKATVDGTTVTMSNGPTATLYTYTPHLSANQAFVTLFTGWFGSTQTPGPIPTTVPPTTRPPSTKLPPETTAPATIPPPPTTSGANGNFVENLYWLTAGRFASDSELNFWLGYLGNGGDRTVMVNWLNAVPEHRQSVVANDYRQLLRRAVDAGGSKTWTHQLALTGRNDVVLAGLASSSEYYRTCADNDDSLYVKCLYIDLLGRPVDAGGFKTWTNQLATGAMSRRTVAQRILASGEYTQRFVAKSYKLILGRNDVDPGGMTTWSKVYRGAFDEDRVFGGLERSGSGFNYLSQ